MQTISEFDEDYANVLDHCEHHLAKAFRLRFGAAVKLDLVQFANAVNEQRNISAEVFLDIGDRGRSVFDDVVQYRRFNRLCVHAHISEFLRNCHRVCNVGFAGLASLALVGFGAEFIRAHDRLDLLAAQVAFQRIDQVPQTVVAFRRAR